MISKNNFKTIKIDAAGRILGRLATEIANQLRGKDKPSFVYNKNCGYKVVVYNTKELVVSGNKFKNKTYYHHTGYLGNLKQVTFSELFQKNSNKIVLLAVKGMLPKNRLQGVWLKNLSLIKGNINEK